MAQPNSQPSNGIQYDPLPLAQDHEHSGNHLYNAPPSPGHNVSNFNTPLLASNELPSDNTAGASTPRFIGAALYSEGGGGGPDPRASFTSLQQHPYPSADRYSEYAGSSYALNESVGSRTLAGSPYQDDPSDYFPNTGQGHPMSEMGPGARKSRYLGEKQALYAAPKAKSKRKVLVLAVIASLILLILAILIPLYFAVIRPKMNGSSQGSKSSSNGNGNGNSPATSGKPANALVTGGDGSQITLDDGSTMTYHNKFGGYWYWDENDPFNNGARAQSWSPALNETFRYGIDRIRGVNLGGWLNTEPFISPALYQKYSNANPVAVDEWTLSQAMRADTAGGGISQLEDHYKTFITEQDFAEIAGAGLNYVRIPIGYWAIEVKPGEPFLEKTSWTYFLKAIKWARKYGLRINLDLHAIPGSQNGWNHSGRLGQINFLNGPMGYANAQRTLDQIRVLAEFISQPQYKDVVTMFGVLNEPQGSTMGQDSLSRFYMQAYNIVRSASGTGEGKGPFVSIHDGFVSLQSWANVFGQADRVSLDSHPYLCFQDQSNAPMSSYATTPCSTWGNSFNTSMSQFGLTVAGEFSNAVTDCGLFLNNVGVGTRYEGTYSSPTSRVGSCDQWTDWTKYSDTMKKDIKQFALASMDALQNYFFWTWKIGNSSVSGRVETPAWSYQLGLRQGWMPLDPREADGTCGNTNPWSPPLQPWQTGGAGAGQLGAASNSLAWPPPTISNAGSPAQLPAYVPSGPIPTLPGPTLTGTPKPDVGNGWANADDKAGYATEAAGCSYLDPWVGPTAQPPAPLCAPAAVEQPAAAATPPPTP